MKMPAAPTLLVGIFGFAIVAAGQTPATPTPASAQPPQYQVCSGYFALCTLAKCGPPPSKGATFLPTTYTCSGCFVLNGASVAAVPPAPACLLLSNNPGPTKHIQSRFAVMETVKIATCETPLNNPTPIIWANCLNASCTVDNNQNYATCTCSAQSAAPFVAGYTPTIRAECSGNPVISSESLTDAQAIGNFWTANKLKPFPPPPSPPIPPAAPAKK